MTTMTTTPWSLNQLLVDPDGGDPGVTAAQARAYCGSAHGQSWLVPGDRPPPWTVDLLGDGILVYRLVCHPHSRRPARDQLGNYVYVPVLHDLDLVPRAVPIR